jgi:hypothetical protein
MVDGGDGEQRIEVAQVALGPGVLRPAHGWLPGKVVDENHPQLDVVVVVELAAGSLDRDATRAAQRPGLVGDGVGQPEGRLCSSGRCHQ